MKSMLAFLSVALLAIMDIGNLSANRAHGQSARPNADEVIRRSNEAMAPPIRYRVAIGTSVSDVTQKLLPDGTSAIRIETSSPTPKVSVAIGKSRMEFYPEKSVGIDTTLMRSAASEASVALARSASGSAATARLREVVARGRECFEVTTTVPPAVAAAIANGLPTSVSDKSRDIIPRERRMVIDSRTFFLVETLVVAESGLVISQSAYSNVEHPENIADDVFLPPDGIEMLQPRNVKDYVDILARHVGGLAGPAPRPAVPELARRPAQPRSPAVAPRPTIDARSGIVERPSTRSNTGMRGGLFSRSDMSGSRQAEANYDPPAASAEADEIWRRSVASMKPPIRFRVVCNGSTYLVSQKSIADGGTATRVECPTPLQRAYLAIGDSAWDFYPGRPPIDRSAVMKSFASRAANGVWKFNGDKWNRPTPIDIGGKECWEIVRRFPANTGKMMARGASGGARGKLPPVVPTEMRVAVDRRTFDLVEMRLVSGAGASRLEFKDIEHAPAFGEDQFSPPAKDDIASPRDMAEYLHTLRQIPLTAEKVATILDSSPDIDGESGQLAPPISLGSRRGEFERELSRVMARPPRTFARAGEPDRSMGYAWPDAPSAPVVNDAATSTDAVSTGAPPAGVNTVQPWGAAAALWALMAIMSFGFVVVWRRFGFLNCGARL